MIFDRYDQNVAVCAECFGDRGIKQFIEAEATDEECSFCGATGEELIAAPLQEVVGYIESCLGKEYGNPDDCGMTWDNEDGRYYPGTTYNSHEILFEIDLELPNDSDGSLFKTIASGLSNSGLWCDKNQYWLSDHEQLQYSWEEFCRLIKHERRFFFSDQRRHEDDDEIFSPKRLLQIICEYAETVGLIRKLDRGTPLYRVRKNPNAKTPLDLGPPPPEKARQNRMSPAGISMMYASQEADTALRETVDDPGEYTVATFITDRDAIIVDFSELPPTPTLFEEIPDSMEYDPRRILMFLNGLADDISRPIERDDRVHIEYIPTQVVTEFLRTMMTKDGKKIDGVRYSSSRDAGGASLVLFCDQNNLILPSDQQEEFYSLRSDRWINFHGYEDRIITEDDIDRWGIL